MTLSSPEDFLPTAAQISSLTRDARHEPVIFNVYFTDPNGKAESLFCDHIEFYEVLPAKVGAPGIAKMECYMFRGARIEIVGRQAGGDLVSRSIKIAGPIFKSKATIFSAVMVAPPYWWNRVLENPTPERIAQVLAGIDPDAVKAKADPQPLELVTLEPTDPAE
jgi:hypothetical protein